MQIRTSLILFFLTALPAPLTVQAQIPASINFQAYLTDNAGAPIDQPTSITFALYASATGGTPGWSETLVVALDNGLLSVELGAGATPFPDELFSTPLWLGLTVGTDLEMTPRRAVTATAFAFRAGDALKLDGNTVEDVLSFANSGGIPPGARIPVLDLSVDSQTVDLTGLGMSLDGRSFAVAFPLLSQPQWAPIVLDYTYPYGTPSPLGLVGGSASLFNSVDIMLADDSGYGVRITGATVVTQEFTSDVVDDAGAAAERMGGGSQWVHETVSLAGDFLIPNPTGPVNAGSLRVDISHPTSSDSFFAQGRGPLKSAIVPSGPGQGSPLPTPVVLLGLGPAEFGLILTDYAVSEEITLAPWLSGTRLPVGTDCRLAALQGLSPADIDDSGTPVATIQMDRVVFDCLGISPP